MRVLLVGSGGREHAIAWKLARSPLLGELHCAPGNPGIGRLAVCHSVAADDVDGLVALGRSLRPDLVVVGPEVPLVSGLADRLREDGLDVFGPDGAAARIEGSKAFAKDVMGSAGVPTARVLDGPIAPCVVKVDGLAAGKGVVVCRTADELAAGLSAVAEFGDDVLVEELLEGPELSLFGLTDGTRVIALPVAQDFKRAYDGDAGPNTGGMGSYAPVPGLGTDDVARLVETTVTPVVTELARRGTPFVGTLFAGLMSTAAGPRVLEYNCRFGDPETQSLMPLLDGDLLAVLAAAAAGDISSVTLGVSAGAAVTVVLTAGGYPASGDRGTPIHGVEEAEALGAHVFHAGTASIDGTLVTSGGRVLNVTATGSTITEAREAAYRAVERIGWTEMRCRGDIALAAAGTAAP